MIFDWMKPGGRLFFMVTNGTKMEDFKPLELLEEIRKILVKIRAMDEDGVPAKVSATAVSLSPLTPLQHQKFLETRIFTYNLLEQEIGCQIISEGKLMIGHNQEGIHLPEI